MQNPKYLHYTYYYNVAKKIKKEEVKFVEEKIVLKKVREDLEETLSLTPEIASWVKDYIHELKNSDALEYFNLQKSNKSIANKIEEEKLKLKIMRNEVITQAEYQKDLKDIESLLPTSQNN